MRSFAIPRPAPGDFRPVFTDEIALVPDVDDFGAMLRAQLADTLALLARFGEAHAGLRYASDKWTVRETVGHLADCERVLATRALRIRRGDPQPNLRFDAAAWVPAGRFESRTLASVCDEFAAVRAATVPVFAAASADELRLSAVVGSGPITVAALAYLIAGHERHHAALLRERYLPLAGDAALPA